MEQKISYKRITLEQVENLAQSYNPNVNYTELFLAYLKLKQREDNR